jgi:hypothetical protein
MPQNDAGCRIDRRYRSRGPQRTVRPQPPRLNRRCCRRGHARYPRVDGLPDGGVFSTRAHSEFVKIGLSDNYGVGGQQAFDDVSVVGGVEVFQDFRAAGRRTEGGAHIIFNGDRNSGQRAEGQAGGTFFVHCISIVQGIFGEG